MAGERAERARTASQPSAGGASGSSKQTLLKVRFSDNMNMKADSRFICDVRFINDLPEIPSDPKMLLPPVRAAALTQFEPTSLEREMKRDMLFPADLGISVNALAIERFNAPKTIPPPHPDDAALLADAGDDAAAAPAAQATDATLKSKSAGARRPGMRMPHSRARREGASDVAWLMRTKYITNTTDTGMARAGSVPGGRTAGGGDGAENGADLSREAMVEAIEASFAAASDPPIHPRNPNATPLEVLPLLPDNVYNAEGKLVAATFDGDPAVDIDALAALPPAARERAMQSLHLKSFQVPRPDGEVDSFVALMVPMNGVEPGALGGDYAWVRRYDTAVRLEEQNQTYLLRLAPDAARYADLNTKLALRKRKRQLEGEGGGGREDEEGGGVGFVQPEKFVVEVEERAEAMDVEQHQGGGGGGGGGGAAEDLMRDLFGSDDDDD